MTNLTKDQVKEIIAKSHSLPTPVKINLRRAVGQHYSRLNPYDRIYLTSLLPDGSERFLTDTDRSKILYCVGMAIRNEGKPVRDIKSIVSECCRAETEVSDISLTMKKAVGLLDCRSENWSIFQSKLTQLINVIEKKTQRTVSATLLLNDLLYWDCKPGYVKRAWENEIADAIR